ncbi:hypothetical protein A6P07_02785 [Acidithiobacillus thiooxidans]|uniref:Uncharacterized protein n=1 Tax=Acidithiobacillus thiooxidans TaxID=930 RepID=A0A1C2IJY0_ACITH|nr:hypothetical protein A6P07_02785 [Acidithiobacillus thiooxidans]
MEAKKEPSKYGCRLCNFGRNIPGGEWCPHCGHGLLESDPAFDEAVGLIDYGDDEGCFNPASHQVL